MEPWSQLPAKIVLVTGASSGLGLEFCLDLARAECRIVVAARRTDRLESLCDQINKINDGPIGEVTSHSYSCRAIAVALDVTADAPIIEAAVEKAWSAFGHVDVLINNTGVRGPKISSLDFPEEFNLVHKTNLRGSWLVSKYVGARMRDRGRGGSIINISSLAGFNRTQNHGSVAYGPSKAALDSMTKIMALELGGYNIRVNAIIPGIFKSEITENLFQKSWASTVAKRIIPLETNGTTDPAMTSLIRYLIHDSSNYISGNLFIADAGLSLPGTPIFSSL